MRPDQDSEGWEEFSIPPAEVEGWKALDFGPFEAALAHGDGFTPLNAIHSYRQLAKRAAGWRRVGMDSVEGVAWHRAGFGVKEAVRWNLAGVDVQTARRRRDGYSLARTETGEG